MDDAVANGVGQDGVANLVLPAADAELGAEDGGGDLVPGLNDLQQVAGLRFLQAVEQPLVQNQQGGAFVLLDDLRERAVAASHSQLRKQFRKADIAHLHEVADGGHAQGAGQVGLSRTGRAHEDDVVGFGDVRAGGQSRNHGLVQAAVRVVLNVLQGVLQLLACRSCSHRAAAAPSPLCLLTAPLYLTTRSSSQAAVPTHSALCLPCAAISPVPIHMPSVVLDRYQYTPSPQTIQQPRRTLCTLDSNHNGRPHLLRVRDIRRINGNPQGAMNCSPRDVSNERGDRAQTVHIY